MTNPTHVRISRFHWQIVRQLSEQWRLPHCHVVGMVVHAWLELNQAARLLVRDQYLTWKAGLERGQLSVRNECWLDVDDALALDEVRFEMAMESTTDSLGLCIRGWEKLDPRAQQHLVELRKHIVLKRDGRRRDPQLSDVEREAVHAE